VSTGNGSDDNSCFFFYISGREPHDLAQSSCLPSLCAIPAFGRRWRKAGLGVTDNEMGAWPGPACQQPLLLELIQKCR
jgi:hypothetical protein